MAGFAKPSLMFRIVFVSLISVFCSSHLLSKTSLRSSVKEWHVAVDGDDSGTDSADDPFRTLNRAAQVVLPGEVVTVHGGTYRETLQPPRGGSGEDARIVFRAAPGEEVVIKCSDRANNWTEIGDGVWELERDASYFGDQGLSPGTHTLIIWPKETSIL